MVNPAAFARAELSCGNRSDRCSTFRHRSGDAGAVAGRSSVRGVRLRQKPGRLRRFKPSTHLSGSSVRGRSALSKTVQARRRRALYCPAIVACQHNPSVRAFYLRLLANPKNRPGAPPCVSSCTSPTAYPNLNHCSTLTTHRPLDRQESTYDLAEKDHRVDKASRIHQTNALRNSS